MEAIPNNAGLRSNIQERVREEAPIAEEAVLPLRAQNSPTDAGPILSVADAYTILSMLIDKRVASEACEPNIAALNNLKLIQQSNTAQRPEYVQRLLEVTPRINAREQSIQETTKERERLSTERRQAHGELESIRKKTRERSLRLEMLESTARSIHHRLLRLTGMTPDLRPKLCALRAAIDELAKRQAKIQETIDDRTRALAAHEERLFELKKLQAGDSALVSEVEKFLADIDSHVELPSGPVRITDKGTRLVRYLSDARIEKTGDRIEFHVSVLDSIQQQQAAYEALCNRIKDAQKYISAHERGIAAALLLAREECADTFYNLVTEARKIRETLFSQATVQIPSPIEILSKKNPELLAPAPHRNASKEAEIAAFFDTFQAHAELVQILALCPGEPARIVMNYFNTHKELNKHRYLYDGFTELVAALFTLLPGAAPHQCSLACQAAEMTDKDSRNEFLLGWLPLTFTFKAFLKLGERLQEENGLRERVLEAFRLYAAAGLRTLDRQWRAHEEERISREHKFREEQRSRELEFEGYMARQEMLRQAGTRHSMTSPLWY